MDQLLDQEGAAIIETSMVGTDAVFLQKNDGFWQDTEVLNNPIRKISSKVSKNLSTSLGSVVLEDENPQPKWVQVSADSCNDHFC